MAFNNKKYAGLPDLDLAPDIYETPDLTDEASTLPSQTIRTASTAEDEPSSTPDIDRQGINADEARAHFLGATVDARDVNFSDSIALKRKAYRSRFHRHRRPDGVEELGDYSDSEDESMERKLARLRREVEELKHEMATNKDEDQGAATASSAEKDDQQLDDGVLELSRALDNMYAKSRGPHAGAAAALSQRLAPTTTPSADPSTAAPAASAEVAAKAAAPSPETPPTGATGTGILAHAAAFDSRLALIEAAMGISSSSNPFLTDGVSSSPAALQPVLPALDALTSRLSTLTNLLVGPGPVSAFPTTGPLPPSTTVSTPHLEALSSRVRKLTADTEELASARKRALDAAKNAHTARITSAALEPAGASDTASEEDNATEVVDPAATQRDEQATKIQALYATLPTIQSLHPILPSVLERLRSLRAIHAGAAQAGDTLDELEKRQADMKGEIEQWREGLRVVEEKMGRGEEALRGNVEMVEPWVRDLEGRLERLGVGR